MASRSPYEHGYLCQKKPHQRCGTEGVGAPREVCKGTSKVCSSQRQAEPSTVVIYGECYKALKCQLLTETAILRSFDFGGQKLVITGYAK